MMLNFDFRRTNKKCSHCDRVIQPGEEFYSTLVGDEIESVRLDYSFECWTGPPADCIGWWKSKLPSIEKGKIYWVSRSELLGFFDQVCAQPDRADVAYLTALLLVQKKILSLVDSMEGLSTGTLQLKNRQQGELFEVPVVEVSPQRLQEIQDELSERLFTDQPFAAEAGDEPEMDDDVG